MLNTGTIFRTFIVITLLCITLIGCSSSGSDGSAVTPPASSTLNSINIANAQSVYIAPTGSVDMPTGILTEQNTLFKITDAGVVQEVTYISQIDGETFESTGTYTPSNIVALNDNYLLAEFSIDGVFLIDAQTGKVWSMDIPFPMTDYSDDYRGHFFEMDSSGNLYFRSGAEVIKADLSNPETPVFIIASIPNESVRMWCVSDRGNIAYEGSDAGGNGVLRYLSENEGIKNLPGSSNYSHTVCWKDFDGNLTYSNGSIPVPASYDSNVVSINDPSYSVTAFGTGYLENGCGQNNLRRIDSLRLVYSVEPCRGIFKFDYNLNSHKLITMVDLSLQEIKFAEVIGNDYTFSAVSTSGGSLLGKINNTSEQLEIIMDGQYDVFMFYGSAGEIVFHGLDLNTVEYVFGKIDNLGNVVILDRNAPNTNIELIQVQ